MTLLVISFFQGGVGAGPPRGGELCSAVCCLGCARPTTGENIVEKLQGAIRDIVLNNHVYTH